MCVARVYSAKDGLPGNWINQLFQAADGHIWAGSNAGLIEFIKTADGGDFRFRAYAQSEGLNYQEVESLAEDRNGNLWLGMKTSGAIQAGAQWDNGFPGRRWIQVGQCHTQR
jgi:ligand-binding sensor domain-containing protein